MKTPELLTPRSPAPSRAPTALPLLPAFGAALLRARARGGPGEEPERIPDAVAAQPADVTPPAPWAPQPVPAATPAHERRQWLAALPPEPVQWRLETTTGPLHTLELQRTPEGALHVALASPLSDRTLPTERLRQRLAARGATLAWREEPER